MLEECLYRSHDAGRFRAMRKNLSLVARDHFELIFVGTYRQREFRIGQGMKTWRIEEDEFNTLARAMLKEVSGGEKRRVNLIKNIPRNEKRSVEANIHNSIAKSTNIDIVLDWLMERWQLIPGLETWSRSGRRYCLFDTFHRPGKYPLNFDKTEKELVRKYIASFGPVQLEDISWWCDLPDTRTDQIL